MQTGLSNAWILCAPMIIIFALVAVFHRDAARRMADMTGYGTKEKAMSVSASLAPYPFMILTIFTPITSSRASVVLGGVVYAIGMTGFLFSVMHYARGLPGKPVTAGVYRISRNPMYLSALLMFAGIVIVTLNVILAILFVITALLQHGMILVEEKACVKQFGEAYERYRERTPRYLFR